LEDFESSSMVQKKITEEKIAFLSQKLFISKEWGIIYM